MGEALARTPGQETEKEDHSSFSCLLIFCLVLQLVLAYDVVKLRIVDQSAVLLPEEHHLCGSKSLDVRQVDVDDHEDDEREHQEEMDDAGDHDAADKRVEGSEGAHIRGRRPQAHAGEGDDQDQNRDQHVEGLLQNAVLASQRMILLEEQIVLDPRNELMTIVCLRQEGLVVVVDLAGSAGGR